jgi:hypothetical protein
VENKSQKAQRDTRFVPEVRLTTNVTYIAVEKPTKIRVSFNPNPLKLSPMPTWFFTINPHEEEGNTNFSELNHNPWELQGYT